MRTAIAALLPALVLLTGCDNVSVPPTPHQVTVSAQGSARGVADVYVVRGTVSRTGLDIAGMKSAVDQQVSDVLALGESLSVPADAITADSVSVAPDWQWQPEKRLLGYRVSRDVTLRLSDIDTYASAVTGLARLGINDFALAYREISNQEALVHDALADAMAKARARATVLADSSGRSLGQVIAITEQGANGPPIMQMGRVQMAEASSYQPGSSEVNANITVTFELH